MLNAACNVARCLVGTGVIVAVASAQQSSQTAVVLPSQPVAAPPSVIRAIVFSDSAGHAGLDPRKWAALAGESLESQFGPVIRLGCDDREPLQLITRPFSIADLVDASVEIDVAPIGEPSPAPLALEWSDEPGAWRPLGIIDPLTSNGPHVLALPPVASSGSIRVRITSRSGGGAWLLKSFSVSGSAAAGWSRVQLDSEPLDGGLFAIITDSILAERRVESPAAFLAQGQSIRLIAPAEIGGHPFVRWDLGGGRTIEARRGVRHDLEAGRPAVAHYAPDADPTRLVTIEVDARPAESQQFALALSDDPSFVIEPIYPGDSLRFLSGETATFAAPPRIGRLVFSHWWLDGKPLSNDSALLSLTLDRSMTLLAVYELLGDMNDDDAIDKSDIETFILALADAVAYQQRFPTVDRLRRGDMNGDGQFDEADIRRFVELVLGE